MLNWNKLWPENGVFGHRSTGFNDPCALQESPAYSAFGSRCYTTEEDLILKSKAEEIKPYLDGRCIYIVGMMGSGKTTMGQILATLLGYSFFDSDKLIEETVGGTTIADLFTLHGESFLREHESEVLRKLSSMDRNVISTGGGAVVKPINWKYMHKGIIVFLDVPIEVLARRLTAVGTKSRPLLYQGSDGDYVKTLRRLSVLWKERSELYTNAHIRVSLENLAMKLGHDDVCNITPTQIAIEALMQIESYIEISCDRVTYFMSCENIWSVGRQKVSHLFCGQTNIRS